MFLSSAVEVSEKKTEGRLKLLLFLNYEEKVKDKKF